MLPLPVPSPGKGGGLVDRVSNPSTGKQIIAHRPTKLPENRTDSGTTTHARKRLTTLRKRNVLRFATWKIKTFNSKEQDVMIELKDHKIDICAIQETKKRGKVQRMYNDYIVVYSGVSRDERIKEGVALAIHKKYKDSLNECQYISSRILIVKTRTESQPLNIVTIYAPKDNKAKDERQLLRTTSKYHRLNTTK